ncbi:pectate lyase family protein [Cellvibrio polysaccharolyticus]|uniref:pectate lyase family protein n=1 Tax=Cellvibrio polysaccharolyticus TaxID=2082724 RepID=UPI00188102C4|nr:pectate lyase [Cellvibrio polysaccharolyticus]
MRVSQLKNSLFTGIAVVSLQLFCVSALHAQSLGANLALTGPGAGADGSGFSNTKLVRDGDTGTYTQASGTSNQRVSVKWSSAVNFNTVVLRESGNNVSSWQLVDNDTGAQLASGTTIGSARTVNVGNASTKKINLIVNGSSPLRIAEIEVYSGGSNVSSSSSSSSTAGSSSSAAAGNASVNLSGSAAGGSANLSWSVSGNINAIEVYQDTDSNPAGRVRIASLGAGERNYTATGLNSGTPYWFWVKYRNSSNNTWSDSNAISVTPTGSGGGNSSSSSSTGGGGTPGNLLSCQQANTVQGFASLGGGTTGGAGGNSITVSNGTQLVAALATKKNNTSPLRIYVNGTITEGNSGGAKQFDIKDMENVSILGVGNNGVFDGIGLNIVRANNVIVRNVKIRYNRIGQKDGISIDGTSRNVWIDHNEIHNSLDVHKDYYDELVSGKGNIDNITISYNYLHSSWKTSLWGSSDSNNFDRRVTFHHNYFENVNSRLPLFRFGQAHVYNNYYKNVLDTGINSRMGARIRIDNNYFENVKNPIVSFYSSQIGYWHTAGNVFQSVTWQEYPSDGIIAGPNVGSTVNYNPPYNYSLMSANDARAHVLVNAGVGKVSNCL